MNALPFSKQVRVVAALVDGCSIRATARLCDVNRETVMNLGLSIGEACQQLHDRMMCRLHINALELDEIWAFVAKKQRRLTDADSPEMGDQYTYVALDAVHKAIVSYRVGKRDSRTTNAFALDLRRRIVNRPQITSDAFQPYLQAVTRAFGAEVDYAMLIKEEHLVVPLLGEPDPARISTSFVERNNLSMRMQVRRFTRKTNGFSKKLRNHTAAVSLYVAHHNYCRVHETLGKTPGMALGITSHIWSIGELIEAATSIGPSLARPIKTGHSDPENRPLG
ncbi:MAG: transposase [Candidatus Aenigmarchaeota archaeon]|nr:transposase [Candidatus Aenigmarchaeota archaeon]